MVGIISSNDIIYGQLVPHCVWCVVYWGRYVVSNPVFTRNKSYRDFNKGIKKKQYFTHHHCTLFKTQAKYLWVSISRYPFQVQSKC